MTLLSDGKLVKHLMKEITEYFPGRNRPPGPVAQPQQFGLAAGQVRATNLFAYLYRRLKW
jgi:hypothetical protein